MISRVAKNPPLSFDIRPDGVDNGADSLQIVLMATCKRTVLQSSAYKISPCSEQETLLFKAISAKWEELRGTEDDLQYWEAASGPALPRPGESTEWYYQESNLFRVEKKDALLRLRSARQALLSQLAALNKTAANAQMVRAVLEHAVPLSNATRPDDPRGYSFFKTIVWRSTKELDSATWTRLIEDRLRREDVVTKSVTASSAAGASGREAVPIEIRTAVWKRDAGRCVRCGSRERLEFDHIIPVALGGRQYSAKHRVTL